MSKMRESDTFRASQAAKSVDTDLLREIETLRKENETLRRDKYV